MNDIRDATYRDAGVCVPYATEGLNDCHNTCDSLSHIHVAWMGCSGASEETLERCVQVTGGYRFGDSHDFQYINYGGGIMPECTCKAAWEKLDSFSNEVRLHAPSRAHSRAMREANKATKDCPVHGGK